MKYKIADIAKIANVSPATVSRVLNDQQCVKPDTREAVKSVIEEMGYHPNSSARSLARGHSDIVALVIDDIRNPYYSTLVYNVQEVMRAYGYFVIVINHEHNMQKNQNIFELIEQFDFAGVILTTALEDLELAKKLKGLKCPVVLLNRTMNHFEGDYVTQDNYIAGYQITKHLIELGHSQIAMLKGPDTSSSSNLRYKGYCRAMKSFGLDIRDEWIISGNLKMQNGYQIGLEYAERIEKMPGAIVVGNDMMAIGFMDACNQRGLKIPKDISIGAFDDIDISNLSMIRLTTMREPIDEMSRTAAKFLLERMKNSSVSVQRAILEPELIVRGSTGPAQ